MNIYYIYNFYFVLVIEELSLLRGCSNSKMSVLSGVSKIQVHFF